jgi:hypothetical protein
MTYFVVEVSDDDADRVDEMRGIDLVELKDGILARVCGRTAGAVPGLPRQDFNLADRLLTTQFRLELLYAQGAEPVDERSRVPQRQDSLTDQLRSLVPVAERLGCYDAADFIKRYIDQEVP